MKHPRSPLKRCLLRTARPTRSTTTKGCGTHLGIHRDLLTRVLVDTNTIKGFSGPKLQTPLLDHLIAHSQLCETEHVPRWRHCMLEAPPTRSLISLTTWRSRLGFECTGLCFRCFLRTYTRNSISLMYFPVDGSSSRPTSILALGPI
jgi:hypothetical protein